MTKLKILRTHDKIVEYTDADWENLKEKRTRAKFLLNLFVKESLKPYVIGSVARGDVHRDSDIDLIFPYVISPFKVEYVLTSNGFENYFREIIMATPNDTLKMYIYLSELESISFPLTKLDKKSLEFYNFGGKVSYQQLNKEIRISGIDKRLVLIEPLKQGHREISVIGNEHVAAKQVNVSLDTILERKKVLLKRERFGKTGVYLKRSIDIDESTEDVLKELARNKRIVRKKLYEQ
ncbi:MAG: DNA polymerase subunit beta [Promethearchaeota archaeon]|nr:MAG: DNA polymerase subunit beta [Candidatus Lokiarchaeota archaeon]